MWRTTELFGNLTKDLRFQLSSRARYTLRRPRRSNCQRSNLVVIHHTPALFSKTLSWKRLFGKRMHVKALIDNCITALLWRCLACSEPLFTSSQVPRWSPSWWVSQVLEGCDCPVDTWWLQVSQVIIAGSDGGNQDRYSHPASSPSLVAEFLTERPASRFRRIKKLWNNLISILALTIEYLADKPYAFLGVFLVHKRFGHCWLRARWLFTWRGV